MNEIHELLQMARTYTIVSYTMTGIALFSYLVFLFKRPLMRLNWKIRNRNKPDIEKDEIYEGPTPEELELSQKKSKAIEAFKPRAVTIFPFGDSYDLKDHQYHVCYDGIYIMDVNGIVLKHYINCTIKFT